MKREKVFAGGILILMAAFVAFVLTASCNGGAFNDDSSTDSTNATTLYVTNQSDDTVEVWLTISIYTDTMAAYYVQNVNGIFGISNTGGSGTFYLAPADTVSYTSSLAFSGNLCFGGAPINCPTSQFPTGTNIFEFTLNNNATGEYEQESVEISCVAGVNSFLSGALSDENWVVTTGIDSVQHFHNDTLGNNSNRYGVFPTGCTNCTNQDGAPICVDGLTFDQPNTSPICIIQRSASLCGGSVYCSFLGFTNEQVCK